MLKPQMHKLMDEIVLLSTAYGVSKIAGTKNEVTVALNKLMEKRAEFDSYIEEYASESESFLTLAQLMSKRLKSIDNLFKKTDRNGKED